MKKLAIAFTISGALGFSALGLGAGVANADPGFAPWTQDHDHDWDWDGRGRGHGHDWGPKWRGPGYVGWPAGCVNATDPSGLVTGSLCV